MQPDFETKNVDSQYNNSLWQLALDTIKELEVETGILASGKGELYGCIFGRDSLITSIKLIKAYRRTEDPYLLALAKKILINIAKLQGTEINIESGEEPGKMIHEFRPDNHDHLSKHLAQPWYVYPDNSIRNYDTVDATPLFLIATYRYYQASGDKEFIAGISGHIAGALTWIEEFGDKNKDGFIDYSFDETRKFGGLKVQSWMDSNESLFHENHDSADYPIAPVEVQAYTYLALKLWSRFFGEENSKLSIKLNSQASKLKIDFNEKFVHNNEQGFFLAAAIDGKGNPLRAVRSSMGHVLWSCLSYEEDNTLDCILENKYVPGLVKRIMAPDLFEPKAGVRTLSDLSRQYSPTSYHNGSIWPHDTSMIAEGFELFGFPSEAKAIRSAILSAITHFQTAIELFAYKEESFTGYLADIQQEACRKQAWSAAAILSEVTRVSSDKNFVKL